MTHADRIDRQTSEDRGVSPVIGAVLMVAITVIMAAAIGTFVLDLGGGAGDSAPQATLEIDVDASADHVNVTHRGGDGLDASRTRVVLTNEADGSRIVFDGSPSTSVLAVGDVVTIDTSGPEVTSTTWGGMPSSSDGYGIEPGTRYSLSVIDLESQRVIFETVVTA